jgi:hypothetical protein
MLKGRCACHTVEYEVSDEFVAALICHCSNCRATTGSAFLPWGEIEREKFRVTKGAASLTLLGEESEDHEMHCRVCWLTPPAVELDPAPRTNMDGQTAS